jgi:hypothetical protein
MAPHPGDKLKSKQTGRQDDRETKGFFASLMIRDPTN